MVELFVAGGVTSMDSFLKDFFPSVYLKQAADTTTSQYCKFDSQILTMFTSSLYLAALMSSLVASTVTRKLGRKLSMLFGGILFSVGALVNGCAMAVWMLILGRILLGFGIGFANQVVVAIFIGIKFGIDGNPGIDSIAYFYLDI
ncbi:putative major facilitator, sugar transporter, major facilitator superfamily [Helianthus annuus]|nr:putative major facilitator, sugar transporter, major facilitator superfamily [Helianthus annuus]